MTLPWRPLHGPAAQQVHVQVAHGLTGVGTAVHHDAIAAVELERGLASYFEFYCYERLHMALDYQTPWEVYAEGRSLRRAK